MRWFSFFLIPQNTEILMYLCVYVYVCMCICIYICIFMYMYMYVCICILKMLRLFFFFFVIGGHLGKLLLDSSVIKKEGCRIKKQRYETGSIGYLLANSCQGKVAGVLFRLNYLIHQHALAMDVIQVLDGMNYFHQSCWSNHSSLHVYCCRLTWTASTWLDSWAYIGSITDAYSQ